jgi:hypothetical protein
LKLYQASFSYGKNREHIMGLPKSILSVIKIYSKDVSKVDISIAFGLRSTASGIILKFSIEKQCLIGMIAPWIDGAGQ